MPIKFLDEPVHGYMYKNLSSALTASLYAMDRNKNPGDGYSMSYTEMYESLVVTPRQGWLPLYVLRLLWRLSCEEQTRKVLYKFVKGSLVERAVGVINGQETAGVKLHDLQLDYIQQRCDQGDMSKEGGRRWHAELVQKWRWEDGENIVGSPWSCGGIWKKGMARDEYFRNNLCRHLYSAGFLDDLCRVLTGPQWAVERLCRAEVLGLQEDFWFLTARTGVQEEPAETGSTMWSLETIEREVRLSAPFVLRSSREVWFQLYDRLLRYRNDSEVIREYLCAIEKIADKPWLKSLTPRLKTSYAVQDILLCEGKVVGITGNGPNNEVTAWGQTEDDLFHSIFRNGMLRKNETCEASGARKHCLRNIWAQNGEYVARKMSDNSTRVWNMHTGKQAGQHLNLEEYSVSCCDVTGDGKRFAHSEKDGKVVLWNVETGEKIKEVRSGRCMNSAELISFSLDGKRLVSLSSHGPSLMLCGETGVVIREYNLSNAQGYGRTYDPSVLWTTKGKRVAYASRYGKLVILDGETGNEVEHEGTLAHERINCLSWSADGKRLLCVGDGLSVWDGETGKKILKFGCTENISVASLSSDGRWVAAAEDAIAISVWDATNGERVWSSVEQHNAYVQVVGWLEDARRMFSADESGKIVIWGWDSLERVREDQVKMQDEVVTAVAWSSNDMCVSACGRDGNITMYNVETRTVLWKDFEDHTSAVWCLRWSGDNKQVFSRGQDGKIVTWDGETGIRLWEVQRELLEVNEKFTRTSAYWSHDGTKILTWRDRSRIITMWNGKTGKIIWETSVSSSGILECIAWSADDRKVACGEESGRVVLRWSETGEMFGGIIQGHGGVVRALKWSPDDKMIASSSLGYNGRIVVCDGESGARIGSAQETHVCSLEWSGDGQRLAYGRFGGNVVVWDVVTSERIESVQGGGDVVSMAWSENRLRVATLSQDRSLKILDVARGWRDKGLPCVTQYDDVVCFDQNALREVANASEEQVPQVPQVPTSVGNRLRIRVKRDGLFYKAGKEEMRLATVMDGAWYWSTSCRLIAIRKFGGGLWFFELVQ